MKLLRPIILFLLIFSTLALAGEKWYKSYANGLKAMRKNQYESAISYFNAAKQVKPDDEGRVRSYGMHFVKYFPNREIGICYYHLGNSAEAKKYLEASIRQFHSERAIKFLSQLSGEQSTKKITSLKSGTATGKETTKKELIVGKRTIKLVGERMSVAVFPFQNKGASNDLGEIVLDKMITSLFNQGRFKVIERTQLDKILAEQELGISGLIDVSTAAKLGKGIGVDAIIMGSVAATRSGSISIDARAIDTETATVIVAHDTYSGSANILNVKNAVDNLSHKFTESLPLVEGNVIQIDENDQILLDSGLQSGLKRGVKCIIYKEGPELKHPVTGEVLGRKTQILGAVLVTEAHEKFSVAKLIQLEANQSISVGDKFLTK